MNILQAKRLLEIGMDRKKHLDVDVPFPPSQRSLNLGFEQRDECDYLIITLISGIQDRYVTIFKDETFIFDKFGNYR